MICSRFLLILALCVATALGAAAETFVTDKPTSLRLANPKTAQLPTLQFTGSVQVAGKLLIARETYDQAKYYLRIVIFPDEESAALLPRLLRSDRVTELGISNGEKIANILLDPDTIRMLLSGELPSATMETSVTIKNYVITVSCDQRFYLADLMSVEKRQKIVVAGQQRSRLGCG
jgi:hypothetical protein